MKFNIKTFKLFLEQINGVDKKSRKLIHEKIELVRQNPFRYKKIRSKRFSRVFRVRLTLESKEYRLIYIVIQPNIVLVCLLERAKDYKDLEKNLKKLRKELHSI